MHIEALREYCLSFAGVTEGMPFGDDTLVFKVAGKMFALAGLEPFESVNLKCDPEEAIALRERYSAVSPGYHMNKKHWNTIAVNSDMPDRDVYEWIGHSYELVFASLPKKIQAELKDMRD